MMCISIYIHIYIYVSVVCIVKSSVVPVSPASKAGLIIAWSPFFLGFILFLI